MKISGITIIFKSLTYAPPTIDIQLFANKTALLSEPKTICKTLPKIIPKHRAKTTLKLNDLFIFFINTKTYAKKINIQIKTVPKMYIMFLLKNIF
ncbi:hypothetical protein HMPREF3188_00492 [Tissierellia bacterium KA00581]|nr:hypothetical protein HMPREF3188_00492 [Tissierellia bacterium KA00581]